MKSKTHMSYKHYLLACGLLWGTCHLSAQDGQVWSLQDCLDYAIEHNIQLQRSKLTEEQNELELSQRKGKLFPSLSFSTSQNVSYRPLQETASNIVTDGIATSSNNKVAENGSYGLNASWTVWNGGSNQKSIKEQKIQNQIASLNTQQTANSIQEEIAQLYVQILYSIEAKAVNEELYKTAVSQLERGKEMLNEGLMSSADVAQLETQVSSSRYDIVSTQSQITNYTRQLKELLEINSTQSFEISSISIDDETALAPVPDENDVYEKALATRPEIQASKLNIEAAALNVDIAKAGYHPTISLNAGIGDSHYSGSNSSIGEQMKQNLNASIGLSISVPIFDNRMNRTNVKKAKLSKLDSELSLRDEEKQLFSTIETYCVNAISNQQNFIAAQDKVKSATLSYELLDEQFKNGLKNIVELLTGRDQLLTAQQDKLQSKYNTILNIQLLKFYQGEPINL